jgi:glucose-6-phosphate isomerase
LRRMQTLVENRRHHDMLIANVFAQGGALGRTPVQVDAGGIPDWLASRRVFEGNRPLHIILADQPTRGTLGQLVALYDHTVSTRTVVRQINALDQWDVELGKTLALAHDISINALIPRHRKFKESS